MGENEARLAAADGLVAAVAAELDSARADNIAHMELAVSPKALARATGSLGEALQSLERAIDAAPDEGAPSLGWLIDLQAGEPADDVAKIIGWAQGRGAAGVLGLVVGLAADDPPGADQRLASAAADGVPLMVRLAEDMPPESIVPRLVRLAPARIAFASAVIHSLDTMGWIRQNHPAIVVCFSAEQSSGLWAGVAVHPVIAMIQAGMQVSLATWAPGPLQTSLTDEYRRAAEGLDLTLEALRGLALAGVQASFLPARQKRRLERAFEDAIFGFPAEA